MALLQAQIAVWARKKFTFYTKTTDMAVFCLRHEARVCAAWQAFSGFPARAGDREKRMGRCGFHKKVILLLPWTRLRRARERRIIRPDRARRGPRTKIYAPEARICLQRTRIATRFIAWSRAAGPIHRPRRRSRGEAWACRQWRCSPARTRSAASTARAPCARRFLPSACRSSPATCPKRRPQRPTPWSRWRAASCLRATLQSCARWMARCACA